MKSEQRALGAGAVRCSSANAANGTSWARGLALGVVVVRLCKEEQKKKEKSQVRCKDGGEGS